ncbi:MAG TPA: CAP domain-containing protein, partial [Dehalococcoidia bacterium]
MRFVGLVALFFAVLQLMALRTAPVPTASALTNCSGVDLSIDAEESAFLNLINQYRGAGLPQLKMSVELNRASSWMAYDLATHTSFSHTDSLGRDPWTRMANCDV